MPNTEIKNLSVLHLICSFHVGGAELMLLDLLEAWERESTELDITIVILNNAINQNLKNRLGNIPRISAYCLERPESSKNPDYFLKLFQIIRNERIQIIHSHDRGAKHYSYLLKLLKPTLKLAYTIHDTSTISRFSWVEKFLQRNWLDCNIPISQAVEANCITAKLHNRTLVYNGVNLQRFIYRPRFVKQSQPVQLICIARFDIEKKGQDILIRALALVNEQQKKHGRNPIHCTLAGFDLPHSSTPESITLKRLAEKEGVSKQLTIVLNRTDVEELLKNHDFFVLPSRKEGFGLVLIEAMAAGLPVIASNLQGPAEIITDNKNGCLFEPDSPEALAEKILMLANDPQLVTRFSEEGLKRSQQFSIEQMANRLHNVYKKLTKTLVDNTEARAEEQTFTTPEAEKEKQYVLQK